MKIPISDLFTFIIRFKNRTHWEVYYFFLYELNILCTNGVLVHVHCNTTQEVKFQGK